MSRHILTIQSCDKGPGSTSADTELVEGGQLLAMFIDPDIAAPDRDKHGHGHDHDDGDHDDGDHDDRADED